MLRIFEQVSDFRAYNLASETEFNMTSYSYVAELREINIAVKVKENQCKAREKEQSVHSMELAACALSLEG